MTYLAHSSGSPSPQRKWTVYAAEPDRLVIASN